MKSWILGVALTGMTAGGVTLLAVGANGRHCGSCVSAPAVVAAQDAAPAEPESLCCDTCPSCKPSPTRVYDVTDLKVGFQAPAVEVPFVSFDEPPLAKSEKCELLPPPREVR